MNIDFINSLTQAHLEKLYATYTLLYNVSQVASVWLGRDYNVAYYHMYYCGVLYCMVLYCVHVRMRTIESNNNATLLCVLSACDLLLLFVRYSIYLYWPKTTTIIIYGAPKNAHSLPPPTSSFVVPASSMPACCSHHISVVTVLLSADTTDPFTL